MSVVCDSTSVIVRCDVVEAKYPHGIGGFESDAPNGTYCSDGSIARIGFMTPGNADAFIERLTELGFTFLDGGEFVDIAVVDEHAGLERPCWWLQTAQIPGIRIACLAGQPVGQVMAPLGWQRTRQQPIDVVRKEA